MIKQREYRTSGYTTNHIDKKNKEKRNSSYKIFFDFGTITSGEKHMPYSCWTYNDDIQQEIIGVHNCAIDMLNNLPTDKKRCYQLPIIATTIVDLFKMFATCK